MLPANAPIWSSILQLPPAGKSFSKTIRSRCCSFALLKRNPPIPVHCPRRCALCRKLLESAAVKTRPLALIEKETMKGESMTMLLNNTPWHMPVTENPVLDSVEIWSFINTTDDSHPIHLHLVRFQILDRRRFEPFFYTNTGEIRYTGPVTPPAPEEAGWKDTVRADPKMVTRIIVRFEGYLGRYVWHCHVLEHEDNEMMRPYDVVAASPK